MSISYWEAKIKARDSDLLEEEVYRKNIPTDEDYQIIVLIAIIT